MIKRQCEFLAELPSTLPQEARQPEVRRAMAPTLAAVNKLAARALAEIGRASEALHLPAAMAGERGEKFAGDAKLAVVEVERQVAKSASPYPPGYTHPLIRCQGA